MIKKIMYIFLLFIILILSINAFGAIDVNNDSNGIPVQSSDSVDIVADDSQGNDNQNDNQGNDNQGNDNQNNNQDDTSSNNNQNSGSDSNSNGSGNNKPTFNFNTTGGSFDFNKSGGSSFNISDILSRLLNMTNKNTNNDTNDTVDNKTPESKVSDVPKVVTTTNYEPVSYPSVEKTSQHIIIRVRDNKTISQGDTLRLEGINKLYDSDFTNGHLLVYVDGKLVFNEITANDLSTPILGITDDLVGQHEISVEFTSNADSNSNTNKYTEEVIIG